MANTEGQSYGGFWVRVLAYLVDSVVIATIMVGVGAGAALLGESAPMVIAAAAVLGPLLYWGLMQASARQATLGKSLLGLKVTDTDGERLSLVRSLVREVAKYVSAIPMGLGFLIAAFTGRKQALHDMLVSTTVVRDGSGHVLVALVVGVFGWLAPVALAMFVGGALLAVMMGTMGAGALQQAMKDPTQVAQTSSAASRAPAAPRAAPTSVKSAVPAPSKDLDAILDAQLRGFDKPGTTRAGPAVLELSTLFQSSFWIKAYVPQMDELGGDGALTITLNRVADASGGELYDPKNSLESGFFQRLSLKPESSPLPHLGATRQVSLRSGASASGVNAVEGTLRVQLPLKPMLASFTAADVGAAQSAHGVEVTLRQLKGKDVELEASGPADRVVAIYGYGADGSRIRPVSTSVGGGQMKFSFGAPVTRVEAVIAEGYAERAFPFTLSKTSVAGAPVAAAAAVAAAPAVATPPVKAVIEPKTAPVAAVPTPVATARASALPGPIEARTIALPAALEPLPGPSTSGPKYNDLMSAVMSSDVAGLNELLAMGKWPDKPDSHGLTPLMAAAMRGDRASAEALLKGGADIGRALNVARERRDAPMLDLLERYATSKRP